MNFEDTIVSEISQSQKNKNCMIAHLYKVLRIIKFIEIETYNGGSQGLGGEENLRVVLWILSFSFAI